MRIELVGVYVFGTILDSKGTTGTESPVSFIFLLNFPFKSSVVVCPSFRSVQFPKRLQFHLCFSVLDLPKFILFVSFVNCACVNCACAFFELIQNVFSSRRPNSDNWSERSQQRLLFCRNSFLIFTTS